MGTCFFSFARDVRLCDDELCSLRQIVEHSDQHDPKSRAGLVLLQALEILMELNWKCCIVTAALDLM